MSEPTPAEAIAHCVAKVQDLVSRDDPDRRALLQLGYNLGRLSELTGAGRGPFWDRWKGPVAAWDRATLSRLAQDLLAFVSLPESPKPEHSARSRALRHHPPNPDLHD